MEGERNLNGIWQQQATPRELFYGLRSDGTVLTPCIHIQINCRKEISHKLFEDCVQHFNQNITCFREYISKGENNTFGLILQEESSCTVEKIADTNRSNVDVMREILNARCSAESLPSWQLRYIYKGKKKITFESDLTSIFPHIYQLIFSFNTGTLDDYSCAMICNLFLNNLDCAIKNKQMNFYSHLDLYDIGTAIRDGMRLEKDIMLREPIKLGDINSFKKFFDGPISNFVFPTARTLINNPHFRTSRVILPKRCTTEFFISCEDMGVSIYASLIAIFNNVLLRVAQNYGFNQKQLRLKVLHNVNTKYTYGTFDEKYMHKIGSHMLPYIQYLMADASGAVDLFDHAYALEDCLNALVNCTTISYQEAKRHILIDWSETSYTSDTWNPKYFYSISNLGNLDMLFPEHENNSFYTLRYDRSRAVHNDVGMDIVFYVFKGRLNFCIDYSTQFVSDDEICNILDLLKADYFGMGFIL